MGLLLLSEIVFLLDECFLQFCFFYQLQQHIDLLLKGTIGTLQLLDLGYQDLLITVKHSIVSIPDDVDLLFEQQILSDQDIVALLEYDEFSLAAIVELLVKFDLFIS